MKIKIKENAIQATELKNTLLEAFSSDYQVIAKNPSMIVIAKTKIIGVKVFPRENSLLVVAGFPTTGVQLIFTLLFILLGIIIPLLIYFLVLHHKMKAFENEVATFIKQNYKAEIIA